MQSRRLPRRFRRARRRWIARGRHPRRRDRWSRAARRWARSWPRSHPRHRRRNAARSFPLCRGLPTWSCRLRRGCPTHRRQVRALRHRLVRQTGWTASFRRPRCAQTGRCPCCEPRWRSPGFPSRTRLSRCSATASCGSRSVRHRWCANWLPRQISACGMGWPDQWRWTTPFLPRRFLLDRCWSTLRRRRCS